MSIPTITITGNVLPPNNVAAGGTVSFELNTVAVDLGSGVVVPRKVSTPILSGGAISQAIWPNAAGEGPSRYSVYLEMIPALDGDCPVRIKLGEIAIPVSPSTQDIGALIAAGASATGGAALLEFQFANRGALVTAIASGLVPIPGFTYLAGGLSYLGKAGATGISDLPGLVPLGDICPDHFPGARFLDAGPMIRAAAAYAASIAPAKVVLQDGAYIVTSVEERTVYVSVSADPGVLTATPHKAAVWLAADVSLMGGGREVSTFDCTGIADTFQYGVAFLDYSNGEVSGFKLQGPSATSGAAHATQLSLLSSDTTHVNRNVTVRDLWIKDWASYGFGHQYGSPENVIVSDLLIENTGADGVDHKVRFGPGDPFDNAFGVQYHNIIVRNPGRRITTSVSGMGIRGRAELVNIEVTGVPAGCDGIQMTAGIFQQEETRPSAQRSTLTNFYVKGEDPSAPIVALNCFSSGPMEISNGYIRNGYVLAQAETTSPYGFQDGPSIQGVTVEGCRGGNAFHVLADRTHLIGCRSLSEKAYFDAKRGNLVAGQTELTPPDGISVTPVVVKNGAILTVTTDYTVAGNTVTLSVAALVTDKFIVVQPTARPARIEGLHCQMIGGGGDEYHTTTTGIIPTTAVQNSIVSLGWRDERFPTVGVRPANATPILVPITSGDNADLRIFAKGTGVSSLSGGNGTRQVLVNDNGVGFYNTSPIVKPTASGSTANGAAVKSLSAALAALGLVTDSTTVASENMTTRAALVAANTATPGLGLSDGQVVFAAGLGYMRQAAATDIPDLLGFVPAGTPHFRHYGAAGNNSTDDTAACQAALTAHPGEFVDGEGLTYRINGTLSGVKIRNAKFRKVGAGSLFRAFGTAGTPFEADADFNRGSTQIQSATLAAALSVGDWFAVIAENDPYSGFLSGTSGGKSGELVQVHSISGSTVTITRPLLWTYSTTKRLVMFTWLEGVAFENCDFEMAGMETSDPGTGLFDDDAQCVDVRFALRARFVDCRFHDGRQAGILTHGCVGTIVDACHFYNLASDPTGTTGVGLGYGVHERGMNAGATVTGCSSDNVRTLYTTGAGLSSIWAYGVPVGSVCSGNTMNNHRVGSGASTHEAGAFVKITGNTITNCGSGSIIRAKWCDVSGNTFSLIQGPAVNVVNNGSTSVAQGATVKDNVIFRSNLTVQTNEGAIDDNSPDAVIDGNIIRQCAGPAVQINFTLRSVVTNNIVIDPCQLSGTHGVEYAIGGTGTGAGTPFWTVSGNVIISTDGLCTIGVNKPLNVIVRGAGNTCVGIASEYSGEFGNLELGFTGRPNYGSRDNSEVISGGAINVEAATSGFITLQAESGSADDLNTITGGVPGDEVILRSVSGHTITLKAGTGTTTDNIRTQSGSDVVLTFNPTGAAIIAKAVRMDNVWIIQ